MNSRGRVGSLRWAAVLPAAAVLLAAAAPLRGQVDPAVLEAEQARIAVVDKAKDAVVAVFAPTGQGGGSGVVISPDGYALTNFHVAKPCGNAMKCGMADGNVYDAVIVGVDPTGDVALIKLFGRDDFPCAELGDSDRVRAGDACFAMGNPFMLATNLQPTVTHGIVSATNRYQPPAGTILEYTDCIQTDASINPGNSGGPLFDAEGKLIGINGRGSFEKRGRVNVGVAYAISINQIKNFLGCLHSGRIVDHATLGATVRMDEDGRVVVDDILETSDAYRRGLRYGDELIAFGGRPITTPNGFKNVLGIYPKDWRVPMSFRREGKRYDVLVRLEGVHRTEELIEKTEGRPRGMPVPIPVPPPGEPPKQEPPKQEPPKQEPPKDKEELPKDGPSPAAPQPAGAPPKSDDAEPQPADTQPSADNAEPQPANAPPKSDGAEPKPADAPSKSGGVEPKPSGQEPEPRDSAPDSGGAEPKPAESAKSAPNGGDQPSDQRDARKGETPSAPPAPAPLPPAPPAPGPHPPAPIPVPIPLPMTPAAAPMPEICKQHFEAKRGFANYYFNKLHRDRVLGAWAAQSALPGPSGEWTFGGKLDGGGDYEFRVTADGASLKLPSTRYDWVSSDNPASSLAPPQSGGLLLTLYLWRRLAVEGAATFGDVDYFGTAPLAGHDGLCDVLAGTYKNVECRFYMDPADGRMLAVEMFPDDDADPCEIYFSDPREFDGRQLPTRLEIRHGDEVFAVLRVDFYRIAAASAGQPRDDRPPQEATAPEQTEPARPTNGAAPPAGEPAESADAAAKRTTPLDWWTVGAERAGVFSGSMLSAAVLWQQRDGSESPEREPRVETAPARPAALGEVIDAVQPRIVKIFGAGGFRGMEPYQSGMTISPDGHVLTVFSYVLDTDDLAVVLWDGRRFPAKLLGADPRLEIAVLKIEATELPHFELGEAVEAELGARVLAFSNVFGVAMGNEPATVQHGVVSVVTNLAARRGVFDTMYRGRVYVLDAMTNNPGAAGGALVDGRGRLLAMLGKELQNSLNNTWLNYAIPIAELRTSVEEIRAGKFVPPPAEDDPLRKPEQSLDLAALGIVLVPDVLERTPPYVDHVEPGSPAYRAGILPDDLIVLVGDRLIQSCKALRQELESIDREDEVKLTLIRGMELVEVTLGARPAN